MQGRLVGRECDLVGIEFKVFSHCVLKIFHNSCMGVSILCLCTKELEKVDIDSFMFVKLDLFHRYTL